MEKIIVFSSSVFKRDAKKELQDIFEEGLKFEDLFEGNFICIRKSKKGYLLERVKEKDPIFVHNAIPLNIYLDSFNNYSNVANLILKKNLLEKEKSFRIETITYDSEIKSRDIEVGIGSLLEKAGLKVDMLTPGQLIGIISKKNEIYIGSSDVNNLIYSYLDLSKTLSRKISQEGKLNRAQFKLVEAIERFYIRLNRGEYVLDLGASPGGWSRVLSSKGCKVIAIDGGELNPCLKQDKNIYHIKERITEENIKSIKKTLEELIEDKELSMITNDMNISPNESISIIREFSDYLLKGGKVIMTLKGITKNIFDLIQNSKIELEKNYNIIKIKHLEQNRREVTFYLNKK